MINFMGMNLAQIQSATSLLSSSSLVPKQLFYHIYGSGLFDFDKMTDISLNNRKLLKEMAYIQYPKVDSSQESTDKTRKWLLNYAKSQIETVYIPNDNHFNDVTRLAHEKGTLCVSSQVGCSLTCKFCHTGTQKLERNLTTAEIVSQVIFAMNQFCDLPLKPTKPRVISNIVMMGQGEPLYNYKQVKPAIELMISALHLSPWRITLSTSGIAPLIEKVGQELGCSLAISLHATNNNLRSHLVPINKMYPIEEVLKSCRKYLSHMPYTRHRRITFEYCMLKNTNDSPEEARKLIKLLHGLPCHVNLIPWNAWPGAQFEQSSWESIMRFRDVVEKGGVKCTVRMPRGSDIMAACGQLKSSEENKANF